MREEPTANGSVASATDVKFNSLGTEQSTTLGTDAQLESIPSELFDGTILVDETSTMDLTNCADAATTLPAVGESVSGDAASAIVAKSVTIGNDVYAVGCIDSNLNKSPKFYLFNTSNSNKLIVK